MRTFLHCKWEAFSWRILCFTNVDVQETAESVLTSAAAWSHFTERPILGTSGCARERQRVCMLSFVTQFNSNEERKTVFPYCLCEAAAGPASQAVSVWGVVQSCLCSLWIWRSGALACLAGTWRVKEACFAPGPLLRMRASLVSSGSERWRGSEVSVSSQNRSKSGCVGLAPGGDQTLRLPLWRLCRWDLEVWDGLCADGPGPYPEQAVLPLNHIVDYQTFLTPSHLPPYGSKDELVNLCFYSIS